MCDYLGWNRLCAANREAAYKDVQFKKTFLDKSNKEFRKSELKSRKLIQKIN